MTIRLKISRTHSRLRWIIPKTNLTFCEREIFNNPLYTCGSYLIFNGKKLFIFFFFARFTTSFETLMLRRCRSIIGIFRRHALRDDVGVKIIENRVTYQNRGIRETYKLHVSFSPVLNCILNEIAAVCSVV